MQTKIEIIKQRVTIEDILQHYNMQPNRAGFINCFAHGDKTPSMKVKNGKVHCFGCGFRGDIVDIVKFMENTDNKGAFAYLDNAFNIGLNTPLTPEQKRQWAETQRHRERERKRKANLQSYERALLITIAEQLRALEGILWANKHAGGQTIYEYAETEAFTAYITALMRYRWLDWLYGTIAQLDTEENEYTLMYGTDRVEIMRKIYKGEIKV